MLYTALGRLFKSTSKITCCSLLKSPDRNQEARMPVIVSDRKCYTDVLTR